MKFILVIPILFISIISAEAQVPGVDPILVNGFKSPALRGGHLGPKGPAVKGRDGVYSSPGGSARMARFNAKIMTLTNEVEGSEYATNVSVTTVRDDQSKLCVMDIGSNTTSSSGFSSFGPTGDSAQPVLIRGNVINICK